MRDTDMAYLAGVLDSDGYITIQRTTKNRRSPAGSHWRQLSYSAKVGIAGTRREPHDFAAGIFCGSVWAYKPKNPAHRVQYQWQVSGRLAVPVLQAVRSFLLIKGVQADLALQVQELIARQQIEMKATQKPPYHVTDEMRSERERIFVSVRALNLDRQAAYRMPEVAA